MEIRNNDQLESCSHDDNKANGGLKQPRKVAAPPLGQAKVLAKLVLAFKFWFKGLQY